MDRRPGLTGEGESPGGRHRLDIRWSRCSVVAWCYVTTLKRVGDGGIEQDRVLAVDLEHPAMTRHDPHRLEKAFVRQAEVEHHERLRGGDTGLDR